MEILLKGTPVTLQGEPPKVGDKLPGATLLDLEDKAISLSDLTKKPLIISVVPDIDTSVCALQTKRFNQEAGAIPNINFVTVSNNTKEEQSNWCAAEGVDMLMLHDADKSFTEAFGLLIPDLGRLARAIFVVDTQGNIVYEEVVSEVTNEPNYNLAIEAAKKLA